MINTYIIPFKKMLIVLSLLIAGSMSFVAFAQEQIYNDGPFYTTFLSNSAVGGYDVVSYFQNDGKPIEGRGEFSIEWKKVLWYFASQENLDAFKANPERYAPQYGGFCAWAVAQGYQASGDPNQYSLLNNKLYLNYNSDIRQKWLTNPVGFIRDANKKWPTLF